MKLKKKKGFTLIELMTTIACAAVLMGVLGSSVYFLMKLNGKTLSSASSNYKALMIEDFIRKNNCKTFDDFTYENKNLYYTKEGNNLLVVENIQDLEIRFVNVYDYVSDDESTTLPIFKRCTITYTNLLGNELVLSFLVDA